MRCIIDQIARNQIHIKAIYTGLDIRVLGIFLPTIGRHTPGQLQSSIQIGIFIKAQKDVQIMIAGQPGSPRR